MRQIGGWMAGYGVALVLALGLVACGADPTATPASAGPAPGPTVTLAGPDPGTTFAVQIVGSDAFLAIASDGTTATAYLCDGTGDRLTVATWFQGPVTNNALAVTNAAGGRLTASLGLDTATGSVTPPGGKEVTFLAPRVLRPAGLYRAEQTVAGSRYVAGWIVLPDDQQRGGAIQDGTSNTIVSPRLPTAVGSGLRVRIGDLGDFTAQRLGDLRP
jgi:hypothetical protein